MITKELVSLGERVSYFRSRLDELVGAHNYTDAVDVWTRCWTLAGPAIDLYNLFLRIERHFNNIAFVRSVHKQMADQLLASRRISESIICLDFWASADVRLSGRDIYLYDQAIYSAVLRATEVDRIRIERSSIHHKVNDRPKILHILHGIHEFNSVLIKIGLTFARHHRRGVVDVEFAVLKTKEEVEKSPQGLGIDTKFAAMGYAIKYLPQRQDHYQSLLGLAEWVMQNKPDLIVSHAPACSYSSYVFLCLVDRIKILGIISGPPSQYWFPRIDFAICWNKHVQLDTPTNCKRFPLELDPEWYPDQGATRAQQVSMGGGKVLIVTAGRDIKYNSPLYWDLVKKVIDRGHDINFICIGLTGGERFIPDFARSGNIIRFIPWTDQYISLMSTADIYLDTFPSGGGVTLLDAARLKKATIGFYNDYSKVHDQTTWMLLDEYAPDGYELLNHINDLDKAADMICRLASDVELRRDAGLRFHEEYVRKHGRPDRMVKDFEDYLLNENIL